MPKILELKTINLGVFDLIQQLEQRINQEFFVDLFQGIKTYEEKRQCRHAGQSNKSPPCLRPRHGEWALRQEQQ